MSHRWRRSEPAALAAVLAALAMVLASLGFGASVLAGGAPRGASGESSTGAIGSVLSNGAAWVHDHTSGLVRTGARGARSGSAQQLATPGVWSSQLSSTSGGGGGSTLAVLPTVRVAVAVAFGPVVAGTAVRVPGVRGHVPQGRAPPYSSGF